MGFEKGFKQEVFDYFSSDRSTEQFRRRDDFIDPANDFRVDPVARCRATVPDPLVLKPLNLLDDAASQIDNADYTAALASLREAASRLTITVANFAIIPPDVMRIQGRGADVAQTIEDPAIANKIKTDQGGPVQWLSQQQYDSLVPASGAGQTMAAPGQIVTPDGGATHYMTTSMPDESGVAQSFRMKVNDAVLKVMSAWRQDIPPNTAGADAVQPWNLSKIEEVTFFDSFDVRIIGNDGHWAIYGGKIHRIWDMTIIDEFMKDWPTVTLTSQEMTQLMDVYPEGAPAMRDGTYIVAPGRPDAVYAGGMKDQAFAGGGFRASRLMEALRYLATLTKRIPNTTPGYLDGIWQISQSMASIATIISAKSAETVAMIPPPESIDPAQFASPPTRVTSTAVTLTGAQSGHTHQFDLPPVGDILRVGEIRVMSIRQPGDDHDHELVLRPDSVGKTIQTSVPLDPDTEGHRHDVSVPSA